MRIPITVNKNTLITYNDFDSSKQISDTLQSNNLSGWDSEIPKNLQEICLEAIAKNWETNPILDEIPLIIDRCLLLDILPTELPLKLTVPKIEDDVYWKRCYLERWPKSIPDNVSVDFQMSEIIKINNHNGNNSNSNRTTSQQSSRKSSQEQQNSNKRRWKECFLEMHIRDYLEKLKPEDYDAEKIKELSDLCGVYVKILDLRELQSSEDSPSRIPLNAILTGLQNLTELSICFKQTYVGEGFTWNILQIPVQDIKLLAKGLEKCHLKVFRLQNSDIDDEKVIIILKSLLKHDELQTLDFRHCRISDEGSIALSKFCLQNTVIELLLANNLIGARGVEALSYAICQGACNLTTLDLKLNPIGSQGANHLMKPLTMGVRNIKKVYLNGCGIKHLASLGKMIEHNTCVEELNLSNNELGEEMGKILLQGLRYNTTLTKLDVRMCKLLSDQKFEVLHRINNNKIAKRCPRMKKKPIIIEPQYQFEISEDLLNEIENALEQFDEIDEDDETEREPDAELNIDGVRNEESLNVIIEKVEEVKAD